MSGIDVTRKLRASHPDIEILIFTIFDEEDKVIEAITAGAAGYLLKGTPVEKIVEAIKDVKAGGSVIQPNLARALLRLVQKRTAAPRGPSAAAGGDPAAGAIVPGGLVDNGAVPPLAGDAPPADDDDDGGSVLTDRELEILQIIAKGLSNNEAAKVLGLSKATIRTHLEHIYEKLDVTNRLEAVTEALRSGIITI